MKEKVEKGLKQPVFNLHQFLQGWVVYLLKRMSTRQGILARVDKKGQGEGGYQKSDIQRRLSLLITPISFTP